MVNRVKAEINDSGKASLSIDNICFDFSKEDLQELIYRAQIIYDILCYLEVKRWDDIVRD